jgi:hypothetical protein
LIPCAVFYAPLNIYSRRWYNNQAPLKKTLKMYTRYYLRYFQLLKKVELRLAILHIAAKLQQNLPRKVATVTNGFLSRYFLHIFVYLYIYL